MSVSAAKGHVYKSTKTWEYAFSCAFRQWRVDSHCKFIHGYALTVKMDFARAVLDRRNWVVDFGGLKQVKDWLELMFDHKLVVARDDPAIEIFKSLAGSNIKLCELTVVDHVGMESFARLIYDEWKPKLWELVQVEVREHPGNSGIYGDMHV